MDVSLSYSIICIPQAEACGYGLWVMGYGLWVMGYGLWVMGYGPSSLCRRLQPADSGCMHLSRTLQSGEGDALDKRTLGDKEEQHHWHNNRN